MLLYLKLCIEPVLASTLWIFIKVFTDAVHFMLENSFCSERLQRGKLLNDVTDVKDVNKYPCNIFCLPSFLSLRNISANLEKTHKLI